MSDSELPVPLREPANHVSLDAVRMWRTTSWLTVIVTLVIAVVLFFVLPSWPWWATVVAVVIIVPEMVEAIVMPRLRYRFHRWEVTDEAICTRTGWITTELRIAPSTGSRPSTPTRGRSCGSSGWPRSP